MESRPRVVYDCNIFWRAAFSAGGVGTRCIQLIHSGLVLHFMSQETLNEVRDVLTRPETLNRFPSVSTEEIEIFLARIIERSTTVRSVPRIFRFPRDPKDEAYIELASFVDADYIVTTDRDLLDLMTGIDLEGKQFRQRFRGLKVVDPSEFLRIIHSLGLALRP